MIDPQIQADINEAINRLRIVAKDLGKESRTALRKGANLILDTIQQNAPVGKRVHHRYSTPKFSRRLRAPNGSGKKVATYRPSNLKNSFGLMRFSRSEAFWVGPLSGRKAKAKGFDGYYAHMVERGTVHSGKRPFIRPALMASEAPARDLVVKTILRRVRRYQRGTAFKKRKK